MEKHVQKIRNIQNLAKQRTELKFKKIYSCEVKFQIYA